MWRCRRGLGRGLDTGGRSPANVPVPEEELPAEVALLDDVIICESDKTRFAGGNTHAGKVLHELATQGSSTHQEQLHILEAPLDTLPKYSNLRVIACALQTATCLDTRILTTPHASSVCVDIGYGQWQQQWQW